MQNYIKNNNKNFQLKKLIFQFYFSKVLKYFFIGFIIGNFFGSFLNFFRNLVIWDGFLILSIIIILEIFNYLFYKKIKNFSFIAIRSGLLIGFFVDAFKVGS